MRLSDRELRDAWRAESGRARRGAEGCPSSESLARAAGGELPALERENLTDHLLACSDCAEEYRLARELTVLSGSDEAGSPEASRSPQVEAREATGGEPLPWRRRWRGRSAPAPAVVALAAVFALLSLGLGFWAANLKAERSRLESELEQARASRNEDASRTIAESEARLAENARQLEAGREQIAELRSQLADLSRPQLNAPLVDLLPPDPTRGESASPLVRLRWPEGAQYLALIVHTSDEIRRADYEFEILDRTGTVIAREGGLRKSPDNTFTLILPRALVPEGDYRLRLYGITAGKRQTVGLYSLRVN